jgi:hypothetical protein
MCIICPMRIPPRFPGLRLATLLLVAGSVLWIALEGEIARDLALGAALTVLSLAHLVQRTLGGKALSPMRWFLLLALLGLATGLGSALLTLGLMILKTGLHAHGPEFTAREFVWLVGNLPAWAGGGMLAGAGLALTTLALLRR